jgi:N6-L-threonylcarbamoyladenine synthase
MIVLGIETSCDDTSIGILKRENDINEIISHVSFTQEEILKKWGGVVPEIAARHHLEKLTPLLTEALTQAKITMSDIDYIGVTTHPGLLGPLLTGLNCAKSIALLIEKPIIAVNHLFAHLEAVHLTEHITYPYLGLLVSGGHSLFLLVHSPKDFKVLGSTIDDAAGEAFDKGGKLLGLGYPAGKIIDEKAQKGDENRYNFPIGLKNSGDARLSFSGLKTSLRVFIEENPNLIEDETSLNDICASYQKAIIDALSLKLKYALREASKITELKDLPIVVGGGVACNSYLRKMIQKKYQNTFFVSPKYCTDNGAMIANYASLITSDAKSFPDCLLTDARGRFIDKKDFHV